MAHVTRHTVRFLCAGLLLLAAHGPAHAVRTARPVVLAALPHDPGAFTEGLVWHAGSFYESTGLYGQSSLRQVEPATGRVLRQLALPASEFGEGLARVGECLVQLTWREKLAHTYELSSLARAGDHAFTGEGWGLCYDGEHLVMSDGSDRLQFRDARSFELRSTVRVTLDGAGVDQLNELECVGDTVLANIWQTDRIVQIDARSGQVLLDIDARGLLTADEAAQADVLNGIAYHPETQHFYLTGKWWPWVFEVSLAEALSPVDGGAAEDGASPLSPETGRDAGGAETATAPRDADVDALRGDRESDAATMARDLAEAGTDVPWSGPEASADGAAADIDSHLDVASAASDVAMATETQAALADGGTATSDVGPADGAPQRVPAQSSGCTCALAAVAEGGPTWLSLLALLVSLPRLRRSRSSARRPRCSPPARSTGLRV